MSTPAIRRRRWTRRDYERLVDSGGFGPEDRIELLDGEIWEVSPIGSPHATASSLAYEALRSIFPDAHVRHQLPFALDDLSEPEPDLAVVPGTIRDYVDRHPSRALLLVEVSESTLSHDRGRKLAACARNRIPEYWIVDLDAARLEVYREPAGETYGWKAVLAPGDTITPLHAPGASIAIADLLP